MQPTLTLRCYVCGEEKARGTGYFGAQRICKDCKSAEQRSPYPDGNPLVQVERPVPVLRGKCLIAKCFASPAPDDDLCQDHARAYRSTREAQDACRACGLLLTGAIALRRGTCHDCAHVRGVSGATLAAVCRALNEPLPVGVAVPA